MTLLVDFLEKRPTYERAVKIRDVLAGLKELKKHADQTLGEIMDAAMDKELTDSVMNWYGKIRTKGDPNVHFSGFVIERTKAGDFKSRRLKVKAQSYGVELASAVSSLSESKLNALGLCVSIASALRSPGPWDFIVFDDPIQSWDDEHETQFVGIIRDLVEQEGKQIILLSHKSQWINSVSLGCRTLNGLHYEITGYTREGPHLASVEWASVEQRLREADTIANDPTANTVRLQQAEEEIRLAACQIASDTAKSKLKRDTSPNNMNSGDVRAILNQAGCEAKMIDKVIAAYGTSDDAHHTPTPKSYQPNAQRIRQNVMTLRELLKSLKQP
jgi:NACalpha-BTF3-like transcription factor